MTEGVQVYKWKKNLYCIKFLNWMMKSLFVQIGLLKIWNKKKKMTISHGNKKSQTLLNMQLHKVLQVNLTNSCGIVF